MPHTTILHMPQIGIPNAPYDNPTHATNRHPECPIRQSYTCHKSASRMPHTAILHMPQIGIPNAPYDNLTHATKRLEAVMICLSENVRVKNFRFDRFFQER